MKRQPKRLGEYLIEKKLISEQDLNEALDDQKRSKEFLGAILIRRGAIKEDGLLTALSEQFSIPYVSVKYDYIDWELVGRFSNSLILEHKCFPVGADEYTVTMAIINPLDVWALKKAEEETRGYKMKLVLVSETDMNEVIIRYKEQLQKRNL